MDSKKCTSILRALAIRTRSKLSTYISSSAQFKTYFCDLEYQVSSVTFEEFYEKIIKQFFSWSRNYLHRIRKEPTFVKKLWTWFLFVTWWSQLADPKCLVEIKANSFGCGLYIKQDVLLSPGDSFKEKLGFVSFWHPLPNIDILYQILIFYWKKTIILSWKKTMKKKFCLELENIAIINAFHPFA